MATVRFQRVGQVAGAAYPVNPLTDIKQAVAPPAGAHLEFLTRMGYPFAGDANAAYRTTALSVTYFDLEAAGLLSAFDWLFISNGLNVAGSTKNWISGNPDADGADSGLSMSGGALVTDGIGAYLGYNVLSASRLRYQERSASAFTYSIDTPPAPASTSPLIGSIDRDYLRLHRNSGSPFISFKANTSESLVFSPSLTANIWRAGLWGVNRAADTASLMRDGVSLAFTAATTAILPGQVAIGRSATTFVPQAVAAFGGGRALTNTEWGALNKILAAHSAEMQAIAAA